VITAAPQGQAASSETPPPRLVNLPVLLVDDDGCAEILGVSKRTLISLVDASWMPTPIALGPRMRRWSVDELRAAIGNMPRTSRTEQPASLLRARIERAKATGDLR
jgi:predicted DNA-binding transcriptional regulator AlpA